LPPGLRGIVVAELLSALMGSRAGGFNACPALFTVDSYEKLRPKAAQSEIVRMGRLATGAMVIGFIVGLFRMLVDTPCTLDSTFHYKEGTFFWIVNNINFQYFSILITIISAIVMVVVSYMTEPPNEAQIKGLTFATASADDNATTRESWGAMEVVFSLVVLVGITFAYLYFRN
jgi:SSS family solute:Na+ symporter